MFNPISYTKTFCMTKLFLIPIASLLLAACTDNDKKEDDDIVNWK